jgi:putative glutathione S-transferase
MEAEDGSFERDASYVQDRILDRPDATWPVEAGRYRLVAAAACPWANRTTIVRRLLGLEDAISLAFAGPTHDWRSWQFDLDPGHLDPVLKVERLRDSFLKRFPDYEKGITVPAIVDVPSGHLVTNDFPAITIDFSTQWTAHHRDGAPDLYPEHLRDQIDEISQPIYTDVNNGVYQTGFSSSQQAYEQAYTTLFARLDALEDHLSTRRYLVGDAISEADVRLFTTLIRFDAVYHGHFKCNRNKISEMPALWGYVRDLYQTPGFGDTVHFDQIKEHYYAVHTTVNPTRVVPMGPDLRSLNSAHGREALGGSPFGDGTAPGPPPASEDHSGLPDGMTAPMLTATLTDDTGS